MMISGDGRGRGAVGKGQEAQLVQPPAFAHVLCQRLEVFLHGAEGGVAVLQVFYYKTRG